MKNSLITTVTNILNKKVTEQEAKDFALNQYGVLATYIRQQLIDELAKTKPESDVYLGAGKKSKNRKIY